MLADVLQEFARELEALLTAQSESELASQICGLKIVDRCRCGDDFCATFYTQPKPKGSYGPNHKCVEVTPQEGMIILDVVDGKIMKIEVLFRDEIRHQLDVIQP
ncbi:MAG: hypothetical protein ABSC48_04765 [Terracidiphilus sp.]